MLWLASKIEEIDGERRKAERAFLGQGIDAEKQFAEAVDLPEELGERCLRCATVGTCGPSGRDAAGLSAGVANGPMTMQTQWQRGGRRR